jgi:endogenous inhibitor of DNA gyrase (YacG/DUF329 family)
MPTYRRPCPHCAQEVTWPETPSYPFCSERCRLIDLGAWASGDYRIPGARIADDEAWPEELSAEENGDDWEEGSER